jgi:hypothetical protein
VGKLKKQVHIKNNSVSRKASLGNQPQSAEQSETESVTIDRRGQDRRKPSDRRQQNIAVAAERRKTERRKTPRRRQIDPTTCERDYSEEEIAFMSAMDLYKRSSGRMFPTCSEILEVLRGLGYEKRPKTDETPAPAATDPTLATLPAVAQTAG